jgi:hypothetical protein
VTNLVLYNADTNKPIQTLNNGDVIDYSKIGTKHLSIVATVDGGTRSVVFALDGNSRYQVEGMAPFAVRGDNNGRLNAWTPSEGSHTITATPYSGSYGAGSAGTKLSLSLTVTNGSGSGGITPSSTGNDVTSLVLYNADTNKPIQTLTNGATIDYAKTGTKNLSIVANVGGNTRSVIFALDGNSSFHSEGISPYCIAGDQNGCVSSWTPSMGKHTVTATPYASNGAAGPNLSLSFTMTNSASSGDSGQTNTPTPQVGAPVPVISVMDSTIAAGNSVFVNALSSKLTSGDWIHSQIQWDFGDPGSKYNTLPGFNASHAYDNPGTYTITLTLVNQDGKSAVTTTHVTVASASRRVIYVNSQGNDANSGTSPNAAVRTFARASQLVSDNTEILFARGQTFSVIDAMNLGYSNVTVGAYGSGDKPVLRYTGQMKVSAQILSMNSASRQVTVRDLSFDSVGGPADYTGMADAVMPAGSDITIRDCQFLNLADAIHAYGEPTGLLVQDNTAPLGIRGYFAWVQGSDQVYLGNSCADSMYQHVLRNGGTDRLLIAYNNFTNNNAAVIKGTLNLHKGSYFWVSGNTLNGGTFSVGPLGDGDGLSDIGARATNIVVENNRINSGMQILHGTEHIMIDNNISYGNVDFRIDGYNSQYQRGVADISIENNTGINSGDHGNFLLVSGPVNGITLTNNLYVAPNLVTGAYGAAPVYVNDSNLNSFKRVQDNIWPAINALTYAHGGSNFIGTTMNSGGYQTPAQWDAYSQVGDDLYQSIMLGKYANASVGNVTAGSKLTRAA